MLKKKQKSIKDLKPQERRFGVVLEDIDSKLGLVLEGHRTLDKKVDNFRGEVDKRFNAVDFKFKVVQEVLGSHSAILNSHSETLNSHTEMLVKNTEDIEIIKGDLDLIKNLIKRKVDAEEFEALERRVLLLERKTGRSGI